MIKIDKELLKKIKANVQPPNYKRWTLAKRSGGQREIISIVNQDLKKELQELNNTLREVKTHKNAIAYKKGITIVSKVREHTKFTYHYKFDFSDFFGSFTIDNVLKHLWIKLSEKDIIKLFVAKKPANITRYTDFYLGQGIETSPTLTNILMYKFDKLLEIKVNRTLKHKKFKISRYADDILISCNNNLPLWKVEQLIKQCLRELDMEFLKLNKKKTRKIKKGGKLHFLGVSISQNSKVGIGHAKRKKVIKTIKSKTKVLSSNKDRELPRGYTRRSLKIWCKNLRMLIHINSISDKKIDLNKLIKEKDGYRICYKAYKYTMDGSLTDPPNQKELEGNIFKKIMWVEEHVKGVIA